MRAVFMVCLLIAAGCKRDDEIEKVERHLGPGAACSQMNAGDMYRCFQDGQVFDCIHRYNGDNVSCILAPLCPTLAEIPHDAD